MNSSSGNLWCNLTDDNSATLVSTGRTLPSKTSSTTSRARSQPACQTTTVFAKVDVTFDLTGVGEAGMRVAWQGCSLQ